MEENIMIEEDRIVTRDPKTFCFNYDLPKDVDNYLKGETECVIKSNKSLSEIIIKETRLYNYCPNISMEIILMNTENSKTNEPHKFVLNLPQRLHLRSSDEYVALQNLSIFYTWKYKRK